MTHVGHRVRVEAAPEWLLGRGTKGGGNHLARAGLLSRPVAERGRRCIMRATQLGGSVVGEGALPV